MAQSGSVVTTFEMRELFVVSRPGCAGVEAPLVVWPEPILVGEARFFLLRVTVDWLCRFVTGRRGALHPLANCGVLEVIRDAWHAGKVQCDSLNVNGKRRRSHRRGVETEKVVLLTLPRWPCAAEMVEVRALRRARAIYLEFTHGALTWLYEWCASSDHSRCDVVRPRNSEEERSARRGVFFSRANGAWIAKCSSGVKKFVVCSTSSSGEELAADTYRALLLARRVEAEEWLDAKEGSACGGESVHAASSTSGSELPSSSSWSCGGDVVPPLHADSGKASADECEEGHASVEDPF